MKVLIDIPKEIFVNYDADKFHDCFQRTIADGKYGDLVGNYEIEILELLDKAFTESKEIYDDCLCLVWNDLYWEEELTTYIEDGEEYEDYMWVKYADEYPEKNELVTILTEDNKIDYVEYDGYNFGSYDIDDVSAWAKLPREV